MPIDKARYGRDWPRISLAIRLRARGFCELCGAPNGRRIYRPPHNPGRWRAAVPGEINSRRVVLTVHHIDFDITNNNSTNLLALCQRCHLKLDLGHKLMKRRRKYPLVEFTTHTPYAELPWK